MVTIVRTKKQRNQLSISSADVVDVINDKKMYVFIDGSWMHKPYFDMMQLGKILNIDDVKLEWTIRNNKKELGIARQKNPKLGYKQVKILMKLL